MKSVPNSSPILMSFVYRRIFPQVNKEFSYWEKRAELIENDELRKQAMASLHSKKFHCQGGGVYSLLAGERWKDAVTFIVAYQTISDYLDNLCDRSTSLDPDDFRMLHQSMEDALSPGNKVQNYYKFREEQEDNDYLVDLVKTCQKSLLTLPNYSFIKDTLFQFEHLYSDLQVHKHVKKEERIPRLEAWFSEHQSNWPTLSWYEFSASSGSTLGIFCLVSYAMGEMMTEELANKIFQSYFPFMQGLHILLDYYIDQYEDRDEGDLNFCSYYQDEKELLDRLLFFINQTNKNVQQLPHKNFHEMVHNGLVGLYLADPKVRKIEESQKVTKILLKASGMQSKFFYLNAKIINKFKRKRR